MLIGNESTARRTSRPSGQAVEMKDKDDSLAQKNCSDDALIVAEAGGRILQMSAKAERLFRIASGQIQGLNLSQIVRCREDAQLQDTQWQHTTLWHDVPEAIEFPDAFQVTRQVLCHRQDGSSFEADATISRVHAQGEALLSLVLRPSGSLTRAATPMLRSVAAQAANEIEKRRVSKQLYDDLGQGLSVLKLDLDWLESSLGQEASVCPQRVARMQALLDHIIQSTKTIASALRPPLLDDLGLLPAISWMAKDFQKKTSVRCQVKAEAFNDDLDDPVKSVVFRIVQESLYNVEQHAQAEQVQICLKRSTTGLDIGVSDDGIGMARGSLNKADCFGLIAMRERIQALGGKMQIHETVPHGVTLQVLIPLAPLPMDF